jgi:hypothetical protein
MKNVFFALAFMLIGTFSFANENSLLNYNEEGLITKTEILNYDENLGDCTITVTAYNQDGEIVYQSSFTIWAASWYHCHQLANAFEDWLN